MDDHIQQLNVGPMENNAWILFHETKALIIDAPFETEPIVDAVHGYNPVGIAITHGHFDHINAAVQLRQELDGTPIYLNPEDQFLWHKQFPDTDYDRPLSDEQEIQIGEIKVHTLSTPGHTPGSVCFYVPGINTVFTGDTLFPGGPGATRWDYSDFDQIIQSIGDRLFALPDETSVLPGHGENTSIGAEKPKLSEWIERGW